MLTCWLPGKLVIGKHITHYFFVRRKDLSRHLYTTVDLH